MKFFTIGNGNRSPNTFFDILSDAGVKTLIDVRNKPSGWSPSYRLTKKSDTGIVGKLANLDIEYNWIVELGNPFRSNEEWRELYPQYLDSAWKKVYPNLLDATFPVCFMCGCLRVETCHPQVIADKLKGLGHEIVHL